MKYEEIKVGDVFTYLDYKMTVISKSDEHKVITTVNCDGGFSTWRENELYVLEPALPEEGLLVGILGAIVYRTGEYSGYGFDSDKNYKNLNDVKDAWTFNNSPELWRKATEQEEEKFIEMLKKECEKRGLYEDTKIEKHADGDSLGIPNYMGYVPKITSTSGLNKNGLIFYKGEFATPRKEETTLEQVAKAVKELGDFTVEQTESGVIILTPIVNK